MMVMMMIMLLFFFFVIYYHRDVVIGIVRGTINYLTVVAFRKAAATVNNIQYSLVMLRERVRERDNGIADISLVGWLGSIENSIERLVGKEEKVGSISNFYQEKKWREWCGFCFV